MTMTKTAFVEILQRVCDRCEHMESKQRESLLSRCGEGECLCSCIRMPALRVKGCLSLECANWRR